jgi:corrinoid protein of di/trimethylamine methyltransferase
VPSERGVRGIRCKYGLCGGDFRSRDKRGLFRGPGIGYARGTQWTEQRCAATAPHARKDTGMKKLYDQCADAVLGGDGDRAEKLARKALGEGLPPLEVIEHGFVRGIREVGRLWEEGSLFLPELVMGAEAMKKAMAVLQPVLAGEGKTPEARGRIVIGTIEGDIHDIGKTLVATMLSANGFDVEDLGADVPVARFVDEAERTDAGCIAVSALLTTTMNGQKRVVEELERRSMRGKVKVIVGGAPCSEEWARDIGADGYAGDAVGAVRIVNEMVRSGA